jgi:hypothetical protein
MPVTAKPYTFSSGAVIVASEHNANFDALFNLVNGSLDNTNLASNAAILDTQLAQITTASKVSISALTVGSQAQGDIIYASSNSAWARLGAGTSGQFLKTQGTSADPIWADAGFTAASQAEVEAVTSNTVGLSPLNTKWHPGVAKAWCMFDGTATGTNAPTVGYGVTSITRNSAGNYTVNLAVTFSSTNFGVNATGTFNGGTGNRVIPLVTARTATTITVISYNDAPAAADCPIVTISAFGDF